MWENKSNILKQKILSISINEKISKKLLLEIKQKIFTNYELNVKKFSNDFFEMVKILYNSYLIKIRILYKENISVEFLEYCRDKNIELIIEDFQNSPAIKQSTNKYNMICGCRIFIDIHGIIEYGTCLQKKITHISKIEKIEMFKQICHQKECNNGNILYLKDFNNADREK